jgi:hypothetical protein
MVLLHKRGALRLTEIGELSSVSCNHSGSPAFGHGPSYAVQIGEHSLHMSNAEAKELVRSLHAAIMRSEPSRSYTTQEHP